ncbi:MAG: hypothetical protein B7Y86_11045 [Brevundimonas subvibrioides]|uniref:Uncharacterized protein n=1 Tax=Brevundimonas subvibrioides TaxID=74313 RepID=A0A258HG79_9CAUL|nr:hypothetical protein [Brevundimonas subvibrioides]OYX55980.1 MAG: hypothetical protein B7Y86_11045 [Brevundimonas subvibrioides]
MLHRMLAVLTLVAIATPAAADTRYLAFDPSDRVTTALTRGVTLEVERGWFGAVSVRRIISTTARGSATIARGGPDEARRVLPEGASESTVYSIAQEGDGRGLARALCPGADAAFLVLGRVRAGRPIVMHGAGRWPDGAFRHCVTLSYDYRGEWSLPPRASAAETD